MSQLMETALRPLLSSLRKRGRIPALPTFRSGGTLVDVAACTTQRAGVRRRHRLAISCPLSRFARAPTGATRCLVPYLANPYEFLRETTHPRVMRQPWSAPAAWQFVTALLASPGFAVLVPTQRHADVAGEVIMELPHLCGILLHDAHTAIL